MGIVNGNRMGIVKWNSQWEWNGNGMRIVKGNSQREQSMGKEWE